MATQFTDAMDDDHDPDLRPKEDGGIPFDQSPQSVSRPRAIALVAGAFVFTTLTSLLVTGFQGLHPILVAEKVRTVAQAVSRKKQAPSVLYLELFRPSSLQLWTISLNF
eukprot:TRINITY_DN3053_c0_g1_i2.p1 TRINITY_DN3053_c0_g1~~TRINITY_DN3053_c0_g1_i2.p1  ORF type:complete len:109 (+),score=11.09 TRINITY_DN3053_c0_g1_i2:57-383(+)